MIGADRGGPGREAGYEDTDRNDVPVIKCRLIPIQVTSEGAGYDVAVAVHARDRERIAP